MNPNQITLNGRATISPRSSTWFQLSLEKTPRQEIDSPKANGNRRVSDLTSALQGLELAAQECQDLTCDQRGKVHLCIRRLLDLIAKPSSKSIQIVEAWRQIAWLDSVEDLSGDFYLAYQAIGPFLRI